MKAERIDDHEQARIDRNVTFGREKGEAAKDEEGMQTIKNLAHNMAYVLRKLNA